jgi:uncharacterized protein (DUF736 family)
LAIPRAKAKSSAALWLRRPSLRCGLAGASRTLAGPSPFPSTPQTKGDTAMTNLINFIQFDDYNKTLTGNIASLAFDIEITGEAFESDNDKAPSFRIFGMTPKGRKIEIGGIWEKTSQQDKPYFTLSGNTGHAKLNANLGRYPGQDDETLMAIIPWRD